MLNVVIGPVGQITPIGFPLWEIQPAESVTALAFNLSGWTFHDVTPGDYLFGTAPLTGMPSAFQSAPFIHVRNNNDGEHYIANLSGSGFTLADKGEGTAPSVTITIIQP